MPSMKQQREINELRERIESLERVASKEVEDDGGRSDEKKTRGKEAKNGSK